MRKEEIKTLITIFFVISLVKCIAIFFLNDFLILSNDGVPLVGDNAEYIRSAKGNLIVRNYGFVLIIRFLFSLGLDSMGVRLLLSIISNISVLPLYLLGKELGLKDKENIWFVLLCAFNPFVMWFSSFVLTETITYLIIPTLILFTLKYCSKEKSYPLLIIISLLWTFISIKNTLFIIFPIPFLIFYAKGGKLEYKKILFMLVSISITVFILFYVMYLTSLESPFVYLDYLYYINFGFEFTLNPLLVIPIFLNINLPIFLLALKNEENKKITYIMFFWIFEHSLIITFILMFIITCAALPFDWIRLLTQIIVAYSYISISGLRKINKKYHKSIIIANIIFGVLSYLCIFLLHSIDIFWVLRIFNR